MLEQMRDFRAATDLDTDSSATTAYCFPLTGTRLAQYCQGHRSRWVEEGQVALARIVESRYRSLWQGMEPAERSGPEITQ